MFFPLFFYNIFIGIVSVTGQFSLPVSYSSVGIITESQNLFPKCHSSKVIDVIQMLSTLIHISD